MRGCCRGTSSEFIVDFSWIVKWDRDTYSHMAGSSVELVLSLFCLDTSWKAPHCPWNKNKKELVWVVSVEVYQSVSVFVPLWENSVIMHWRQKWKPYWESGLHQVAMPIRKKGELLLLHVYPLSECSYTCNSWDSVDTTSKCILSTLHFSVVYRDWPWDQNHLPSIR